MRNEWNEPVDFNYNPKMFEYTRKILAKLPQNTQNMQKRQNK